MLVCSSRGLFVQRRGIEPLSTVLQTAAMTTSATFADDHSRFGAGAKAANHPPTPNRDPGRGPRFSPYRRNVRMPPLGCYPTSSPPFPREEDIPVQAGYESPAHNNRCGGRARKGRELNPRCLYGTRPLSRRVQKTDICVLSMVEVEGVEPSSYKLSNNYQ